MKPSTFRQQARRASTKIAMGATRGHMVKRCLNNPKGVELYAKNERL